MHNHRLELHHFRDEHASRWIRSQQLALMAIKGPEAQLDNAMIECAK